MRTISIDGEIGVDHQIRAEVPHDVPPGRVRLIVVRSDEDDTGALWPWNVSQAWSDELSDTRQDIYPLEPPPTQSLVSPNREPGIWARLMQNAERQLSPETADYLLSIQFTDADIERMTHLAERSEAGKLTDDERNEFDSYLHLGNLLAVIHSDARTALHRR